MDGYALTNTGKDSRLVTGTMAMPKHQSLSQRWIVHQVGDLIAGKTFRISSAVDGRYVGMANTLTSQEKLAQTFTISYLGNGKGYALIEIVGKSLGISASGFVMSSAAQSGFHLFSVTYHTGR